MSTDGQLNTGKVYKIFSDENIKGFSDTHFRKIDIFGQKRQ